MIDASHMSLNDLHGVVEAWIDQRGRPNPTGDAVSARLALGEMYRRLDGKDITKEIAAWLRQMAEEERKRAKWADEAALDAGDVPRTLEGDKIRGGARALCAAAKQLEDGSWLQHAPKGRAGGSDG
jgi:hypothetical protein